MKRLASLAAAAALAGCAVGPDYKGPPTIAPAAIAAPAFVRAQTAATDTGPPPARWWEALGDPVLTALVEEAFAANPTLKDMVAQLRYARAQILVSEGAFWPTGGTTTSYTRVHIPTESLTRNLALPADVQLPSAIRSRSWAAGITATWEIDIFGGVRRSVESAEANAQSVEASFYDAQVTLASNVANAYARLREAQNRSAIVVETGRIDARLLALTRLRRAGGTATDADVAQQVAQGARDRSQQFQFTIDQQLDQIAILCGRAPGEHDALLAVAAGSAVEQPLPTGQVPLGTPEDWLRRRPDIRKAERTIQARNATIGYYKADYFPKLSVLGVLDWIGRSPGQVFRNAPLRLVMPSIAWNFWQIPTTRGEVAGAEANRDQALADYESTVLAGLQDVNDALSSFASSQQTAVERYLAVDADARALTAARLRYAGGTATEVDVLNAQRTLAQDRDQSVQARSSLMQNWIALQKSLGLGWGEPPPVPVVGDVKVGTVPAR